MSFKLEQLKFKLEKILAFRNMQEKLEKMDFLHTCQMSPNCLYEIQLRF